MFLFKSPSILNNIIESKSILPDVILEHHPRRFYSGFASSIVINNKVLN